MLKAIVAYLIIVSLLRAGARVNAALHGYDAGRKNLREEFHGAGEDVTGAIFNACIAGVCIWALLEAP